MVVLKITEKGWRSRISVVTTQRYPAVWAAIPLLLFLALARPAAPEAEFPPGTLVLVTDFVREGCDGSAADGLKPLFGLSLEQSDRIRLFSDAQVRDSLRRMLRHPDSPVTSEFAKQICRREGIPLYVTIRLSCFGDAFAATAQVVEMNNGRNRIFNAGVMRASGRDQLPDGIEHLARSVRSFLGESAGAEPASFTLLPAVSGPRPEAVGMFSQALAIVSTRDYERGIELLERSLALEPRFPAADALLARLYERVGKIEVAQSHAAHAADFSACLPKKEKHRVFGTLYHLRYQYKEALEHYQLLEADYPKDWSIHFELGRASLLLGDPERALREFQTAVELDDSQPDAYVGLCMAGLYNQNVSQARQAWELASGLEPDDFDVLAAGGFVDLVENGLRGATEAFQKALASKSGAARSSAAYLLAQTRAYSGQFQLALDTIESGIEQDRQNADTIGESDKRLLKAEIYLLRGQTDKSEAECSRVAEIARDPIRLVDLGTLYAKLGRIEQARKISRQLENTLSPPLIRSLAAQLQGEIELAVGNPDKAVEALVKAKAVRPAKHPSEPLARALAKSGSLEAAEREYHDICTQKAAMLFPPDSVWFTGTWVRALFDYALLLQRLGRREDAHQYLRNYLWVLDGADKDLPSIEQARILLRNK